MLLRLKYNSLNSNSPILPKADGAFLYILIFFVKLFVMLFITKIVSFSRRNVHIKLLALLGFVIFEISLFVVEFQVYSGYILAVLMSSIVMAAIFSKNSLAPYSLEKDMVVYEDRFVISNIIFPFQEIKNLDFHFVAFKGMSASSYYADSEADVKITSGTRVHGIENVVSFQYKNQHFAYQFYVNGRKHFLQFISMLKQFHALHINFTENNGLWKTWQDSDSKQVDQNDLTSNPTKIQIKEAIMIPLNTIRYIGKKIMLDRIKLCV